MAVGLAAAGLRGPLKPWREQQLQNIFTTGQTLRLQFPKEDLGFVYDAPGSAFPPEQHEGSDSAGLQPAGRGLSGAQEQQRSLYVPEAIPGARMPHATLRPPGGGGLQDQLHFVLLSSCSTNLGSQAEAALWSLHAGKSRCDARAAACALSAEQLCPSVMLMVWRV